MILALDLSITQTGWACGFEGAERPKQWGSITPKATLHRPSRIYHIVNGLAAFILDPSLTAVYAEDLNVGPSRGGRGNLKSALALAEVRGAIQLELWRARGFEMRYIHPSTAKSAMRPGGFRGLPSKEQIRAILDGMGIETANEDESDAIAVWMAARNALRLDAGKKAA